jgi:hypothetical protein
VRRYRRALTSCLLDERVKAAGGVALLVFLVGGPAKAEPVARVDVTNATTVLYAADNRDFAPNQVATIVNDDWGVFYNRLNVQATREGFGLSLRLDTAWYFVSPDPTAVALELVRRRPPDPDGLSDPAYFRSKVYEAGGELSNRYINWTYPAKLTASYRTARGELVAGDFYAELGRGFVLSVRKRDELASDDSIRGLRLTVARDFGVVSLKLTALGGALNPLRIDEGTGRYLGVDDSVTPSFLAVTEAGMPRAIATDFAPETGVCASTRTCTYAPDRVVAAQLELGVRPVKLGTQGSVLVRQPALSPDIVRSAESIFTGSQSVNAATSDGSLDVYAEGAFQKLFARQGDPELDPGYALFASGTVTRMPLVLLLEGKHYRRFFPLRANVDTARAREFSLLSWSAPPTTQDPSNDTELDNFNTCVTGGRARGDYRLRPGVSVFSWLGYFETYSESSSNDRCEIGDQHRNRVWDTAVGFELASDDGDSRGKVSTGTRFDDTDRAYTVPGGTTNAYYRELSARYELTQRLGKGFTLELSGTHRRRRLALTGSRESWLEGEHLTALDWGIWSVGAAVEYNSDPLPPNFYVNGSVRVRPTSQSSIALFAGQRRSSLRCVGGVCQVRPGFEGLRLDGSVGF